MREVISRYLGEWERVAWVRASRGSIEVRNPRAMASYGAQQHGMVPVPVRDSVTA